MAHALAFESAETLRTVGSPKSTNEIPNPNRTDSMRASKMKNGSWPPFGSGPPSAGGQMTGPSTIVGTAIIMGTRNTLTQGFKALLRSLSFSEPQPEG
jgi:hypothetical protein